MAFLQPSYIVDRRIGSGLDAAVIAVDGLRLGDFGVAKAIGLLLGSEQLDILTQRMATISLDLSATLTWPSTRRWRAAKADTIWIAALARLLWAEPRNVLPSKAITSADTPISLATQATKRR